MSFFSLGVSMATDQGQGNDKEEKQNDDQPTVSEQDIDQEDNKEVA